MLKSYIGPLYYLLTQAETIRARLANNDDVKSEQEKAELRNKALEILSDFSRFGSNMNLTETVRFIERIKIANCADTVEIAWILESVIKLAENEADQRYCYLVDKKKSDLYEAESGRWGKIIANYPSISEDVRSALICYAVDQHTACVFHLMRVAETGLRTLARERRVRIPKRPLTWADWQRSLSFLTKKIDNIGKRKHSPAKDSALAFYQGALLEFAAFRETYRSVATHARKSYDEFEAASALVHVREFMLRLSAQLRESDNRAIKWGRF